MNEETSKENIEVDKAQPENQLGPISHFLTENGLENESLDSDHLGIEIVKLKPDKLLSIVSALKGEGFNYLQCQGGYDEGPGLNLVCFYHLIAMDENTSMGIIIPREVRLKIFLDREGDLKVPSLYKLFKGADWQERETYDMFGINFKNHPHPKRLLMPEDWKGWPLRKDYVSPDFYEMQDAY